MMVVFFVSSWDGQLIVNLLEDCGQIEASSKTGHATEGENWECGVLISIK